MDQKPEELDLDQALDQADLIPEITLRFAKKFEPLAKVKIKDTYNDQAKDDPTVIVITPLGVENIPIHNENERIQCREVDENGNTYEYLSYPPAMLKLSYIVTPHFKTYNDCLRILGSIVKIIKDDGIISVEGYNWLKNDNVPIKIQPMDGMTIEKQMQIFTQLRLDYRPSLFYEFLIGINSGVKEKFKRVEERDFRAIHKKG